MEKNFSTGLKKSLEAERIKLTRRRRQLLREMGYSEDLRSGEIAEKLHEQTLVNDALNRDIARQEAEINKLKAEIAEQKVEIAEQKTKIAELEAGKNIDARKVVKTSANSSVPPSKNPIGIPHTQSQRKPSGKKTGGQNGHTGSTRLQSDSATYTERWFPAAVCPVCGKPLDMDSATVCATRQVVDIPLPIAAEVINHLQMQVKCTCGHCSKGLFPEAVNAPMSFGPNITALVSYLSTYQNIPFKRLTHLLETIFGLHISEGSVSNMLNSMRKLSKTPYEIIRKKVANGTVAGADETGVNVNGKNNWLWAFQNAVATYLAFDKSRGHNVINDNFTPEELGGKAWVTDRWPAYFMGEVGMDDHQICIAHLLRNLTYTMQAFPDDAWSLDMMDLLRDSVHGRNKGDTGQEVRMKMEKRLDELLSRPPFYKKENGDETELDKLKKSIAKHKAYIFTFLTNPEFPPTNNDSEKALRPAKTKLKVSGCFRTETGVENYATVASVIQTAVKNGQNPFEVLRVIATLAGA